VPAADVAADQPAFFNSGLYKKSDLTVSDIK
jgi:hypothetical protein